MARLGVKGAIIGGEYIAGDLSIVDGLIDQVGLPAGDSGMAVPGFVDVQVNGFGGIDLSSASTDEWLHANRLLANTGVTSYLANIISNDATAIDRILLVAEDVRRHDYAAASHLLGLHLEGPFLAPVKAGIHSREFLTDPTPDLFAKWCELGPVVMTTIAPELPGALQLIREAATSGVVVSLGHSNCTAEEAQLGFEAGAATVTHIFNAMAAVSARAPGLAGMALSREEVWLQLILDFVHVDQTLAKVLISLAPQRLILVTDCLPATGTLGTSFALGGTGLQWLDGKAVNSEGTLAGSVLTMDQALRNAVSLGMSEIDAVNATSLNPMRLLDPLSQGPLNPGMPADVIVLNDNLEIDDVLCKGATFNRQEVV